MPRTLHTEKSFIQDFHAGSEKAFDHLFKAHYPALTLFAYRLTRDSCIAEEIAEDAFIKLWERKVSFSQSGAIQAFLYAVVRNACLNHLRAQKRERSRYKDLTLLSDLPETDFGRDRLAAGIYADIHATIQELPPQCSLIFRKIFIEGKDYRQIAEEMKLTVSTIRNQKARAIQLLRKRLKTAIQLLSGFFLIPF